jgi:hypothetical protein
VSVGNPYPYPYPHPHPHPHPSAKLTSIAKELTLTRHAWRGGGRTFAGANAVVKQDRTNLRRRHFLGVLSTVGVALTAAEPRAAGGASGTAIRETRDEKSKARYRVTDDVRAFYRVNHYPVRRG